MRDLTLFKPMEFAIKLYTFTIKPGRPIVYIEGSQVIISKLDFVLINSDGPNEMSHNTI